MLANIDLISRSESNFITLDFAKQYLRVDNNSDNQLITEMIKAVAETAQNYLGLKILPAVYRIIINNNQSTLIKIPLAPIKKITEVKILRGFNYEFELLNSDYKFISKNSEIKLKPNFYTSDLKIICEVGFSEEELPTPIKQGMLEHLARIYDQRGSDYSMPIAAKAFYQAYKRINL